MNAMREQFEKVARAKGINLTLATTGEYAFVAADHAWWAWQAALSIPAVEYGPDNPPRLRKQGESVEEYRAAMGWVPASEPADTDKLREAILTLRCNPNLSQSYKGGYVDALHAAAKLVASTALQAPVREVPEGWKLTRCEDGTIIVSKNNIGGYAAWKDDSNIASSILYHFADEFLATVPAAPVQQEGE